ncbi:MAG: T9SS type A sorting domain-containing protein [Flavobacteriales bacterium]|nr:T9SS type A sorting domain-containing protein [Flavobacteriales bacterium]
MASATHIIGGEIYWDCITEGEDAGKLRFYLKLYRDCSQNTMIPSTLNLQVEGHPSITLIPVDMISQTDITPPGCGFNCATAGIGDRTTEEFIFASAPVVLNGVPPAQGWRFIASWCCRTESMSITSAPNYTMTLEAVMYPYNGENVYPCFDSSPRSAEAPSILFCAGQDIRYNAGFVDPNADSLLFSLTDALHENGIVPYSGYTGAQPLPGPNLDPSYPLVSLNPATGQMDYDLPGGLQGRWVVVTTAEAYRCGQLISRNSSDMLLTVLPCTEQNEIPAIATPQWSAPETASGFEVTVNAGDLVNFVLEGVDTDMIGSLPQMVGFTASGTQFGAYYTDPDSGCGHLPCATLSGIMPGEMAEGAVSTVFNWQTDCAHVMGDDACLPEGSTYHFQFRYRDNFCPVPGNNLVTVAVTVLPDPVVESPTPRCVAITENGEVNIEWAPVEDTFTPASFAAYSIYHSSSPTGPFQEIGTLTDINAGSFSHTADNPVAAPSVGGQNHYRIRTRSGCNGAALYPQTTTVSTMGLTAEVQGSVAMLSWTPVTIPALPGTSPGFRVMRKLAGQQWEPIATVSGFTFSDFTVVQNGPVLYRVEQDNNLPCASMSPVAEGYFNVGIDRSDAAQHISIIPNPSDGRIIIRSESGAGMSGYALTDLSGKVLLHDSFTDGREYLNLATELSPGVYLLRVGTKVGFSISRVVIH